MPFAPRPFSHPSTYSMSIRALRRDPSVVILPSGAVMLTGKLSGSYISGEGSQPEARSSLNGSAAVFMWKMCATHPLMKPC